jgi:hypothetical protein
VSRELDAAVRSFADENSARLQAIPSTRQIVATIATVTAGAARDGNSLVTVTWRGRTFPVNGYNRTYTPVVGHRVICDYIDDQLFISSAPVGTP